MAIDQGEPAVVFVPSFMQRARSWDPVLKRIRRSYRSQAIEPAAHDFEGRLAEIDAATPRGAALVGYSMGGRLALHVALRAASDQGRFGAVVVIGASPGVEDPGERADRHAEDERLATWMEMSSIEEVVTYWERLPALGDQSPELVAAQRPDRLSHDPADLARLLRSAGQGVLEPIWDRLATLETPLLAVAGEGDPRYVDAAARMAALVGGRARVIEKAGHAVHLEQPEAFSAALLDFLDQHLGQRRLVDGDA